VGLEKFFSQGILHKIGPEPVKDKGKEAKNKEFKSVSRTDLSLETLDPEAPFLFSFSRPGQEAEGIHPFITS
jgi:hypothetical protein